MIKIKRVYEPADKHDGYRVLVDRLWPRGIKKEDAHIDLWLKEIAPSTALRKWFNHEAEKWDTFRKKYYGELKGQPALKEMKQVLKEHTTVTLLYGAKNENYNQAIVLAEYLRGK
ncbi:MAG: DUF488 domain-containing protein [Terrimonas sp.]|uniref:DUF488 domain-containing protein n=1 Tax=Terrimonas sp. TaxID=1914338 RepID=UPI00092A0A37|nr:DUF488 domain-containing protein [Terrimonas sp.]MBN8789694.1 DUF488 domain-containing protein [Terrimonas sp.]OJY90857.1 MAG: MarR family transcriptional regulator [Sphingobacteriales bacterium 40-81]PVD51755.1 DUF488 domain-containing protein [Terrimonas sp.]